MPDSYLVELKESVFRETPFTEEDFEDTPRIEFTSKHEAEEWISELNESLSRMGQLTLHTAHPNDTANVDAYVVFKPSQSVWVPDS